MSQLKQIVQNSLRLRDASEQIINGVDTLIQRAIIDLQRSDLLPPRKREFVSLDEKQEHRDSNGELVYNFYYLPEDFRKLDYFRPRTNNPYHLTNQLYDLYDDQDITTTQPEKLKIIEKRFGVFNTHKTEDSPYEKMLVAFPFPDEDEIIELSYYSNGTDQDWEWIDETYWESVISWIYAELGLKSHEELEDDIGRVVSQNKEMSGHNLDNETFKTLSGSYFGKRNRDYVGNRHGTKRRYLL